MSTIFRDVKKLRQEAKALKKIEERKNKLGVQRYNNSYMYLTSTLMRTEKQIKKYSEEQARKNLKTANVIEAISI